MFTVIFGGIFLALNLEERMKIKRVICGAAVTLIALLALAGPVLAHHSFVAEFDGEKKFVVTGVITKLNWTNPHIAILVDVKGDDGNVEEYTFASGPPGTLHRAGLREDDIVIGQEVTITANPAKDGAKHLGWLQMIKFPDGHLFVYRNGAE
jgi:Family of unknown function (DUF6152)